MRQMWHKNHLKSILKMGNSCAIRHCYATHTLFDRKKGGTMKIVLIMMAGLTIGALIIISAIQLLKVVIQEMVDITTEAWYSSDKH